MLHLFLPRAVPADLSLTSQQRRDLRRAERLVRMRQPNYRHALVHLLVGSAISIAVNLGLVWVLSTQIGGIGLGAWILGFVCTELVFFTSIFGVNGRFHAVHRRRAMRAIGLPVCMKCCHSLVGLPDRTACPECGEQADPDLPMDAPVGSESCSVSTPKGTA